MRSSHKRMQRHAGRTLMSRRQALSITLAGLLSGLGTRRVRADQIDPAGQVATATKPKSIKMFTASGAGDKSGNDWQNAMPIKALSEEIGAAPPGAGFLIGFEPAGAPLALDTGQIRINASGAEGNPVFLEAGVMAEGAGIATAAEPVAAFFKSAQPWSLETFGRRGSSYFALTNGASHLRISGFRIDGTPADGFFKFRGKESIFEDIVFSDIEGKNVGRVIETERGAVLRNITVADCRAVGIVRGFARFRNLSDSVLRNLELDAANMDAGGENVCQLISVVAGENLLFENVVLRNAINQPPPPEEGKKPKYVQGDGIVCERETTNVTIRKCHASSMGDGGFDIKSTNVTMEDCTSDSCKFGARIWARGDNVIRRCDFRNPVSRNDTQGACVQAGGTLQIIDSKLHAGPGTVAIDLSHKKNREGPAVVMRGGSIQLDGSGAVVHASGDGVLELHDVMVNGVATTKRYVFEKKEK